MSDDRALSENRGEAPMTGVRAIEEIVASVEDFEID